MMGIYCHKIYGVFSSSISAAHVFVNGFIYAKSEGRMYLLIGCTDKTLINCWSLCDGDGHEGSKRSYGGNGDALVFMVQHNAG